MSRRLHIADLDALHHVLTPLELHLEKDRFWPRYNISPHTALWAVYSEFGKARLAPVEWAMVPPWARPGQFQGPLTIARSETVWERASFKNLIRRYRAVIPVNGFYVWPGKEGTGQPWHISAAEQPATALAAIYQFSADGVMQICLLTVPENGAVGECCERLPVVIDNDDVEQWLNEEKRSVIDRFLQAPVSGWLKAEKVSTAVNDRNYDAPDCIARLDDDTKSPADP